MHGISAVSEPATTIKDWTPEEYEKILIRAQDDYAKEYKNGRWPGTEAMGLYAYAHLMRPKDFEPAIRLAEMLSHQYRDLEAIKLCEFAFNNYDGPHSNDLLGWSRFKETYAMLARSYKKLGIFDKALRFAKASGETVLVANLEAEAAPRAFKGGFPEDALKRELESLGCKFHDQSSMCVSTELTESTWVFWLRDEEQLNDLTPEKLGNLCCYTKVVVCSSMHLQRLFEARLPFLGSKNVHVIHESPLAAMSEDAPSLKENLIVFVGAEADYVYLKEAFTSVKGVEFWHDGPCGNQSSFVPAGAFYVFCGPSANRHDVKRLIQAQAAGVTCLVSAVDAMPEYLMRGRLFKPPYSSAHVRAMAQSAVTLTATKKSREEAIKQAAEWTAGVHKAFSAKTAARQWLQTLRPYL